MTDPELVEVTQEDREAAAERLGGGQSALAEPIARTREMIVAGKLDGHAWVQAFARHRIAAIAAYEAEQWRPISEAPKDATRFLAIDRNGDIRKCVRWVPSSRTDVILAENGTEFIATHYRPLPAPPVGEG